MNEQIILNQLKKSPDGITLTMNGEIPKIKNGYYVSISNNIIKELNFVIIQKLRKQLNKNQFIGYWFDKQSKKHYLDISIWITNKQRAIEQAKRFSQKAVWDIENKTEISIGDLNV